MTFPGRAFSLSHALNWPAVLLLAVIFQGLALPAHAQSPQPTGSPAASVSRPDALWRCELPGGVYLVALRSIVSISTHEYVVDGAARVTEVTVATASSVEARFYYLEPLSPNGNSATAGVVNNLQDRAQDLVNSHSPVEPVWQKVVKNYPATTHAHTVEYRLVSKANLQQLYQSLELAWTTGKGVNYKTE